MRVIVLVSLGRDAWSEKMVKNTVEELENKFVSGWGARKGPWGCEGSVGFLSAEFVLKEEKDSKQRNQNEPLHRYGKVRGTADGQHTPGRHSKGREEGMLLKQIKFVFSLRIINL